MADPTISGALCGVVEKALIAEGMSPAFARILAKRACEPAAVAAGEAVVSTAKKGKKKASAYNRKYKAAFKRVAPRYKLKSGKWKAGGFKRAVKEAHRIAGGKKR